MEVEPESKRDIAVSTASQQLCVTNDVTARLEAAPHEVDAFLDLLVVDLQHVSVVGLR